MLPTPFLAISGGSLIVLGVLQLRARPRDPAVAAARHYLSAATAWSLACIGVGLLVLSQIYWPFDRKPAAPTRPAPASEAPLLRPPPTALPAPAASPRR